jgi:hypothetical protein
VVNATYWLPNPQERDIMSAAQKAVGVPGSVWMDAENLAPNRVPSIDHPACRKSLYQLAILAHNKQIHPNDNIINGDVLCTYCC